MAANDIRSKPAAAAGISLATGVVANWTPSAWSELTAGETTPIYIEAITFEVSLPSVFQDTTGQSLIEIATGGAGSETTIIQIPSSGRNDTAAGYWLRGSFNLPEPVEIAQSTRIAVRLSSDSSASGSVTFNGIKLRYREGSVAAGGSYDPMGMMGFFGV